MAAYDASIRKPRLSRRASSDACCLQAAAKLFVSRQTGGSYRSHELLRSNTGVNAVERNTEESSLDSSATQRFICIGTSLKRKRQIGKYHRNCHIFCMLLNSYTIGRLHGWQIVIGFLTESSPRFQCNELLEFQTSDKFIEKGSSWFIFLSLSDKIVAFRIELNDVIFKGVSYHFSALQPGVIFP